MGARTGVCPPWTAKGQPAEVQLTWVLFLWLANAKLMIWGFWIFAKLHSRPEICALENGLTKFATFASRVQSSHTVLLLVFTVFASIVKILADFFWTPTHDFRMTFLSQDCWVLGLSRLLLVQDMTDWPRMGGTTGGTSGTSMSLNLSDRLKKS